VAEPIYVIGDRVSVTDPALARLRDIMRNATGQEPTPNHHGTVTEVWADSLLITFDDGLAAAPYPFDQCQPLTGAEGCLP
jgi:hypothetical protein